MLQYELHFITKKTEPSVSYMADLFKTLTNQNEISSVLGLGLLSMWFIYHLKQYKPIYSISYNLTYCLLKFSGCRGI